MLPIVAGLADYLENLGIITMLKKFPELTDFSVNITSAFSLIKALSTSIFFIILILVLLAVGFKNITRKDPKVSN